MQQMRWTPRGAHLSLQVRVQALNDDYVQLSNAGIRPRGNAPLSIYRPAGERPLRTATPAPAPAPVTAGPRTSRLCVVSAGPSASRPSLSAWAPKPITVNHRPRQLLARSCNRDGVINPANSLKRGLHGTQDGAMLGGVVAPERVDDNVCHERTPGSGDRGN